MSDQMSQNDHNLSNSSQPFSFWTTDHLNDWSDALSVLLQPQLAVPHPISHAAALASQAAIHATMPPQHLVATSPALASPVGSATSPNCSTPPCSTLFVANLGQFVSEQELKDMFGRYTLLPLPTDFYWFHLKTIRQCIDNIDTTVNTDGIARHCRWWRWRRCTGDYTHHTLTHHSSQSLPLLLLQYSHDMSATIVYVIVCVEQFPGILSLTDA